MSRRCEQDGCRKQPSFGYPGGRPVRCATHRLKNMVGTLQACHGKSELLPRLRVHTSLLQPLLQTRVPCSKVVSIFRRS